MNPYQQEKERFANLSRYSNLCQEVILTSTQAMGRAIRPSFQTIRNATVDVGSPIEATWYTVYSNSKHVWDWLRIQKRTNWYNHPGELVFDIHEELYTLLILKFG